MLFVLICACKTLSPLVSVRSFTAVVHNTEGLKHLVSGSWIPPTICQSFVKMQEGVGSVGCGFGGAFFSLFCSFPWRVSWWRPFPAVKGRRNATSLVCACVPVDMCGGRSRLFSGGILQWQVQGRPLDAANPTALSFILFIGRGKGIALATMMLLHS